jgi:hypothetical protein
MPVEIRELVIQTTIASRHDGGKEALSPEKLALLKSQVVQECLRALRDKSVKSVFDR